MKISAVLLIGLAVLIAVVPPLTECAREGKLLVSLIAIERRPEQLA